MAEEVAPEEQVEQPKIEAKEEPKKEAPKLDTTKPLSQQTNKILEALPAEEEKKEEVKDEEEPKEEAKEEEPVVEDDGESYEPPKELEPVAQYILERLPDIQVVGHTSNGKDKVFNVKRAEDLPEDFEFSSRRAELVFNAAIASQELNARQLLAQYQKEEQDSQIQQYLNQQALDVQSDISELQSEGLLPQFKYNVDDPKFDSDPAVKIANQIYEMFEKTNETYVKAGKTYRISYRDAAEKFLARQPKQEKAPAQKEREEVAQKVSAPQGAGPEAGKIRPRSGWTTRDVIKLYNAGKI